MYKVYSYIIYRKTLSLKANKYATCGTKHSDSDIQVHR